MTLNLMMSSHDELKPRITVFGVGGAGGNAVNNMIDKNLEGVEFVVANTDAQALQQSRAPARIQMGVKVTEGLGAGARPSVGAAAAEETIEEIVDHLAGAHMCFITAGMGGGTGTGAAPIIAQAARELGVLTVGVVTKPFQFEGNKRMKQADEGIEALQKVVDTLIIIPNQNLFRLANEKTTFTEAFAMADDVLYQGVKGVTDLMVRPGLINLDFADVRAVMDEMGKAMMGTGEGIGEDRAIQAAEKAIANPLLDEISLRGAKGVLINITGGYDLTLFELDEAANRIREEVDPDANIIVGSTLDPSMEGMIRVSVVATGIDAAPVADAAVPRRRMDGPLNRGQVEASRPLQAQAAPQAAPMANPAVPVPIAAQATLQAGPVARTSASQSQSEPELFDDLVAEPQGYDDDAAYDDPDVVPPPAYRPQAQQPVSRPPLSQQPAHQAATHQPASRPSGYDSDASSFVAPRARPAGTPSPEALARLQQAVNKAPLRQPVAQAAARPIADKPRFGINSLIHRMTGHSPEQAERTPLPTRQQPPVTQYEEDPELDPDQERNEIPAFLRRQAN